ncbi:LysR family transcriptional regulator [Lampropedia puyangensis]|uniref:LysR family transcriptional regulator n=1 Tax=Lampropedia puyangensis TaxID=1330072 RepID=A0A4S8FAU8_9BURK|nr:substrate-binding domain-containing protein [Lampropedia puyangensis]THU04111.1 LysR family transcriptional regulator [Lampropedia puyangensis]
MHKVSIKPQWTIEQPDGRALSSRVIELLTQVHRHGSLATACQQLGASYRHAWQLVREGESLFGAPLLLMERGKGSKLTALGEKLVWADHRIQARLAPTLDSLASELAAEIERITSNAALLRIHASYGLAINQLLALMRQEDERVQHKYVTSVQAVSSLHDLLCDVAGFPVPMGIFEQQVLEHYTPWLDSQAHFLINVCTRRQGFMVAAGNPLKIYEIQDLARPQVRFINRQRESSTRLLLDCMLQEAQIDPHHIHGYEQGEYTHAAVAAYVASGMADVGFGLEAAARQFQLDFIPVATERYFLLCHEASRTLPGYQTLLNALHNPLFSAEVNRFHGYAPWRLGEAISLQQAFPGFTFKNNAIQGLKVGKN